MMTSSSSFYYYYHYHHYYYYYCYYYFYDVTRYSRSRGWSHPVYTAITCGRRRR